MRDLISARASGLRPTRAIPAVPAIWAGFLTLLVGGPWLGGGYIFGTDWPGPRRFDFPVELSDSAPWQAVLAAVSLVVSSEWTGKLFVLGLLFVAALMAFRAAPTDAFVPRAAASTIYVFNPFVYGRLHYGQLFLLAGYAVLPWVAIQLRELLWRPSVKGSFLLALSLALLGITSTHVLLVAGLLVAVLPTAHLFAARKRLEFVRRVGPSLLLAFGAALIASAYWVLPLALDRGRSQTELRASPEQMSRLSQR